MDSIYSLFFLNDFVPKLKTSLYENIINSPPDNIKLLDSNRYETIKNTLVNLSEK